MSHPVRAVRADRFARIAGSFVLLSLLAAAACTTEFITEGGSCAVDGDCETGEVCHSIPSARDPDEVARVCLRACTVDRDCVTARDEICRLDPDGESGVCGRLCARDSDCPGDLVCRFEQCIAPEVFADSEPAPDAVAVDAAPADAVVDGGFGDAAPADMADMASADGAPTDDAAPDGTPADAAADADPVDPADMAPPADDAAPDMAPADPM